MYHWCQTLDDAVVPSRFVLAVSAMVDSIAKAFLLAMFRQGQRVELNIGLRVV